MKIKRHMILSATVKALAAQALALASFHPDFPRDGTIVVRTAVFDDGYEADIKLCNGDAPYVDAVLFHDGAEVMALEPREKMEGLYVFESEGREFEVEVV